MLKIAHLSDLHLGYSAHKRINDMHVNVREQDGYDAFSAVVQDIIDHEIDIVVVGGDVFHDPTPSVRAILEAQNGFRRLADAGIKVYSVAGNHDTNDIAGDIAASRIVHDEYRGIYSHAEPYVKHEIADGVVLHMVSHHMYASQAHTMGQITPETDAVNIFTTHGSCVDPILEIRLKADMSPREIVIPDELLLNHKWDCVMLGHIHERGFVGASDGNKAFNGVPILYNGSLIRRGFSDQPCELGRGWTEWHVGTDGKFTPIFHTVAQRPQFDLPVINAAECTDLTSAMVDNIAGAFEGLEDGAMPIVRQRFTNITPARRASIDWTAIKEDKANMLSWQCGFESPQAPEETPDDDGDSQPDLLSIFDDDDEDSKGKSTGEKIKAGLTGNLFQEFDKFLDGDYTQRQLAGLLPDRRDKVTEYSRAKVREAYDDSLTE